MAKVSIHLVTWNGQKYIEECLNSVLKQTFEDYFLLIIDNGSIDKTVSILENEYAPLLKDKIRFIKNKNNLGFAQAHNQAILWTESEYVLVLNQDVILEPDFLQKMVEFLDQNKDTAAVSGKVLRWHFENDEEMKNSLKSDIIDSLGLKIFKSHRAVEIAGGEEDQGQYDEKMEIFGASAACPFYRRKALEDIRYEDEYFDNDFFSYKEDVDLAYRLQWRGWRAYYLPQAVAYHERSAKSQEKASGLRIIKQRQEKNKFINYHSYKNHLFVLTKNISPKNFHRYFIYIFFYELKKILYISLFEWSTLKALKEYLAKRKKMKRKHKFIMKNRIIKDEDFRKWLN